MQTEANILQRIARAYVARRSARLLCVSGVLGAGVLLFLLTGGFPPSAWSLLAQALPHIAQLVALHGQATLLALLGLILLSLTLLIAWGALLWLSWRMLAYWRYERRELRHFAQDAAQAYYLADDENPSDARAEMFANNADDEEVAADVLSRALCEPPYGRPLARYSRYPLALEEASENDAFLDWRKDAEDEEETDMEYAEEEVIEQPSASDQRSVQHTSNAVSLAGSRSGSSYLHADQGRTQQDPQVPRDQHIVQEAVAYGSGLSALPTQPMRPLSVDSVPGGLPSGRVSEQGYPSRSGRVVPFVAPTTGHGHPPTGYYSRVPLPPVAASTPPPSAHRPTTRLVVSTGLDAGLKRKDRPNEDSLLALQNTRMLHGSACPVGLFVVADGMGGHSNGQEASRMVIQALSRTVVPSIIYGPTDDNYAELLAEGVHHANLEVYQRNRQEKANMGTTIAAALVVDTTAYVVSAGDSRVYLYRASSGLSQVTRDHSTVARMVENGLILPEDVYTHPRRNEIYRSLGHHPSEDLDSFILALQPEDILLLCSDGLWEMVRDASIEQVIASTLHQPGQIGAALVQAALEGGGKDNIGVIVVSVKAEEEARAAWAVG